MRAARAPFRFARRLLAALVGLVVGVLAWAYWSDPKLATLGPFAASAGPDQFTFDDVPKDRLLTEAEADAYAERLVGEMSLVEKTHQMTGDTWYLDLLQVLLSWFKYNDAAIPAGRNPRLGIPPLLFSDGPRGVVMDHSTCFPVAMARGASWDVDLERRVGDAIGRELRAGGANLFGGVCVNLLRHPGWGRAQETYGEDPWLLGEMGSALALAVQAHGVMACVKHFALNSIEENRYRVDVRADERTLREVYLPHFRRIVEAGAAAVMSAYNRVNGEYCAENAWLLRRVLREDWGFRGFVISDFFDGLYDARRAALAGLDVEMPRPRVWADLDGLVRSGAVPEAVVDEAARRLLRTRTRFLARPDRMAYGPELVVADAHVALAREAAEKSMVLLKNAGGVLPLDGSIARLAVLGRLADAPNLGDHGSSRVYPPRVVTPLAGLRERLGAQRVAWESGSDPAAAVSAARAADAVVVVVGLDHEDEGEYIPLHPPGDRGGDRRQLGLHARDVELVQAAAAANPRTVVVLIGGSAITVEEWRAQVPAILMAWYPGMEGGHALARLLFGDVSPSGKLPLTVPADPGWLPPFDPDADAVEYGPYHGYTLAEKLGVEPAFAFGHGLSYTSFAYSDLRLSAPRVPSDGSLEVSVDVTNTGARPGEEIVQLYVGFPESRVERPAKLLRGFEKVPLAPGETRTVALSLRAADLAWYDVDAGSWRVDEARYHVLVGPSSRDDELLSAELRVVGAHEPDAPHETREGRAGTRGGHAPPGGSSAMILPPRAGASTRSTTRWRFAEAASASRRSSPCGSCSGPRPRSTPW